MTEEAKGGNPMPGYLAAGCGGLLLLLSMAVAAFGAFHVFLDPRGKISADEAAPALGGGCCCMLGSVVIVALGVFLAVRAKKSAG